MLGPPPAHGDDGPNDVSEPNRPTSRMNRLRPFEAGAHARARVETPHAGARLRAQGAVLRLLRGTELAVRQRQLQLARELQRRRPRCPSHPEIGRASCRETMEMSA